MESKIMNISGNFPIEVSNKVFVRRKPVLILRKEDPTEALEYIGSAFKNQDTLRGLDFDEAIVYLKDIIGVSPNNDQWEKATKDYWCNIRVPVPHGLGRELEIGFAYKTEEDKKKGESGDYLVKQQYGRPINISDYVVYRYCLVYKRVARNLADIQKSPNIRFYLYSKAEAVATQVSNLKVKDLATSKRLLAMGDRQLVDDILVLFDEAVEFLTPDEKDIALEKYATSMPSKFIEIAGSPTIKMKSFIERCIRKGILRRIENTDTIIYPPNEVLGSNIDDAVIMLQRPNKSLILNTLKAKLQEMAKVKKIEPKEITATDEVVLVSDLPDFDSDLTSQNPELVIGDNTTPKGITLTPPKG